MRRILETEQKALEINLDEPIYGAFAEIGAGQEVARHFFQVGAAAGTIAKSMSAYDKVVSDEIYGPEQAGKGRYVCESRLYKMLNHEYALMEQRLRAERPNHTFFAFADTVAAINFSRTIKGDGWLGLRFQLSPDRAPNDLILHVRLLDRDNRMQQQAIGVLGVNMVYGCFRYFNDPKSLLLSLMDNLHGRVALDMVRLSGPDFSHVDNRLICLWVVELGLSHIAIFGPDGNSLHAGEFLYRRSIMISRGSYRPPTRVQQDMIRHAFEQFRAEREVEGEKTHFLTEITLENLQSETGKVDEQDYLDRTKLLCALGQTVVISNFPEQTGLIAYFTDYKVPRIGFAMGVRKLEQIIHQTCGKHPDNLLTAFGQLFLRNVRFYIYPARNEATQELITVRHIQLPFAIHFLFDHLLENKNIVDVRDFDPNVLSIYQKKVLEAIRKGDPSWEKQVPSEAVELIKSQRLFGHP
jgi:hypothetical protein